MWGEVIQHLVVKLDLYAKIIDDFLKKISASATPATEFFLMIRQKHETQKMPDKLAATSHYTTAQPLLISVRASQNLQTSVAFLTT